MSVGALRHWENLTKNRKHCSVQALGFPSPAWKLNCLINSLSEECDWRLVFYSVFLRLVIQRYLDVLHVKLQVAPTSDLTPVSLQPYCAVRCLSQWVSGGFSSASLLPGRRHPSYIFSHLAWWEDRWCSGIRSMALEWHMCPDRVSVCVCRIGRPRVLELRTINLYDPWCRSSSQRLFKSGAH